VLVLYFRSLSHLKALGLSSWLLAAHILQCSYYFQTQLRNSCHGCQALHNTLGTLSLGSAAPKCSALCLGSSWPSSPELGWSLQRGLTEVPLPGMVIRPCKSVYQTLLRYPCHLAFWKFCVVLGHMLSGTGTLLHHQSLTQWWLSSDAQ
jgi:hypothetical protein